MAFNFQTFLKGIRIKNGANPAISSNTLANPTVITTSAPHGLISGNSITIAGSNSTPVIDGARTVTVLTTTTFTVPVNVTVAGTAGTYVVNNLSSEVGDISVDVSTGKAQYHNGTTASPIVTEAHSATLTNKTFDADGTGNSITNIENADIKTGAAIDRAKLASGSNNHVIVNDGSGVMVSQAQLSVFRGGTGIDTSVSSGVAKVAAGTWSVSSIVNGDITDTTITDAKLATIFTPLKVSNSATTATSANTASAIVARDGTNNFSAGTITANLTGNVSGNVTGTALYTTLDKSLDVINYSITATVSANALTIDLKDKAGNAPSASSPVMISYRNATSGTGTYTVVSTTAAITALVVSAGSTLGTTTGVVENVYVYAINNSGSTELAVSTGLYDEGEIVSTTAEGGAGAADSSAVMYSTTARSNVPCRLIARLKIVNTATNWTANPSVISLLPFEKFYNSVVDVEGCTGGTAIHGTTDTHVRRFSTTVNKNQGKDITYADSATLGSTFTINSDGVYSVDYLDSSGTDPLPIAITVNCTSLTARPSSITKTQVCGYGSSIAGAELGNVTVTRFFKAGDIIRANYDNSILGISTSQNRFFIMRVG